MTDVPEEFDSKEDSNIIDAEAIEGILEAAIGGNGKEIAAIDGSYTTHRYNRYELLTHLNEHILGEHVLYLDENAVFDILQHEMHNYLASGYTFMENVHQALESIDEELHDDYEKQYYKAPAHKPILGLRNYTQHYRPLPLKPKFETEDRTECQAVVVELDELDYAGHWNMSKQRHFFADVPTVDENEMNLAPMILEFEELVDELADWARGNSFGMGETEPNM